MSELKAYKCDELSVYCKTTCTPNGLYYDKPEADTAIAELKQKLEDAKSTAYAESVDAGMRERRLKRALYIVLARSFCCMRELAARNALYDDECKWDNFKTTCLKKAEEYK